MPILILLKEPRINLKAEGNIDDKQIEAWDAVFNKQILMFKNTDGKMTVVPLLQECNIAVMEEITKEELAEQEKRSEERRKKTEAQGGGGAGGGLITKPTMGFPSGRQHRRR